MWDTQRFRRMVSIQLYYQTCLALARSADPYRRLQVVILLILSHFLTLSISELAFYLKLLPSKCPHFTLIKLATWGSNWLLNSACYWKYTKLVDNILSNSKRYGLANKTALSSPSLKVSSSSWKQPPLQCFIGTPKGLLNRFCLSTRSRVAIRPGSRLLLPFWGMMVSVSFLFWEHCSAHSYLPLFYRALSNSYVYNHLRQFTILAVVSDIASAAYSGGSKYKASVDHPHMASPFFKVLVDGIKIVAPWVPGGCLFYKHRPLTGFLGIDGHDPKYFDSLVR